MSHVKKILAGAAMLALGFSSAASAAVVTLTPVVTAYWASDANVGNASEAIPAGNGAAGAYRVDFQLATALSQADITAGMTGFGNIAFTIGMPGTPAGHLTDAFGGYVPIVPSVRTAGDGARFTDTITGALVTSGSALNGGRVALMTDNSDSGSSTSDFKFIYADLGQLTAFAAGDPRITASTSSQNANLNQVYNGNTLTTSLTLGSVVVHFDGSSVPGGVKLPVSFGTGEGYSLHNNTTTLHGPVLTNAVLGSVTFGTVPEPTSLALLAVGAIAGVRRRRA